MNPCIGPAPQIIAQAIALNLLCRPVHGRLGSGEALSPTEDSFERVSAWTSNYLGLFHPTPEEILADWMLTTRDLLQMEYERTNTDPF